MRCTLFNAIKVFNFRASKNLNTMYLELCFTAADLMLCLVFLITFSCC